MRPNLLLLAALSLPLSASAQQEQPRSSQPTIERTSNGITVIRGSGSRPAPKAETGESATPEAASAGAEAAPKPKGPEKRQRERVVYDSNGRRSGARTSTATSSSASGDAKSLALKLRTINGREVPYLTESEKVVRQSAGLKVSERIKQAFSPNGAPAGQQMDRIEERKLADGTVETVTTTFVSDLNGRMQPSERTVQRRKESNGTTRTVTSKERSSLNGRFSAYEQEESIRRELGEDSATIETVRKTSRGGSGLEVSSREETQMRKENGEAVTETKTWQESPASGKIELASRTVGKLVEQPDGSSSEVVEVYGFQTAGGGVNVNASRMQLQKKVETETTVGADGSVRARTTTRERSIANPSQFGAQQVSQQVSKPTPDGESVRTDVYEQGLNGRMRATESIIEKIEK